MEKRQFLRYVGSAAMATPFLPLTLKANEYNVHLPYPEKDSDAFWERIRMDYRLKPEYINLENGYYNFVPMPILEKFVKDPIICERYNGKTRIGRRPGWHNW